MNAGRRNIADSSQFADLSYIRLFAGVTAAAISAQKVTETRRFCAPSPDHETSLPICSLEGGVAIQLALPAYVSASGYLPSLT